LDFDSVLFAAVLGEGESGCIAVRNDSCSVQENPGGEETGGAEVAQNLGLIGGCQGQEKLLSAGNWRVSNLDDSRAENILVAIRDCDYSELVSEAADIEG